MFDPAYEYLFNSYYEAVGPRHPRPQRGLLTRPGRRGDPGLSPPRLGRDGCTARQAVTTGIDQLVELGLHHEQQHQELILMDVKHLLSLRTR